MSMTPFYNCQISQFPLKDENHQSHIPFLSLKTTTFSTSSYPYFLHQDQQHHIPYDHEDPPHQQSLQQQQEKKQGPVKWMSSKMRIMKKMLNSDQAPKPKPKKTNHQPPQDTTQTIIRVCSDCSTTKTPLWRSGPHGPKSLCNACGIRQRKARRAADGKDKRSDFVDRSVPFKKRKHCVEDVVMGLNERSDNFQRVFPQDEKDAAILLMALSCGFI